MTTTILSLFLPCILSNLLAKPLLTKMRHTRMEGIVKFGLPDKDNWKLIRHNALEYWIKWDINKIFTIEEIN